MKKIVTVQSRKIRFIRQELNDNKWIYGASDSLPNDKVSKIIIRLI